MHGELQDTAAVLQQAGNRAGVISGNLSLCMSWCGFVNVTSVSCLDIAGHKHPENVGWQSRGSIGVAAMVLS